MHNIRYFANYDENGELINIGTVNTCRMVQGEITADEYEALRAEIEANAPDEPEPVDPIDEALAILRGEVTE